MPSPPAMPTFMKSRRELNPADSTLKLFITLFIVFLIRGFVITSLFLDSYHKYSNFKKPQYTELLAYLTHGSSARSRKLHDSFHLFSVLQPILYCRLPSGPHFLCCHLPRALTSPPEESNRELSLFLLSSIHSFPLRAAFAWGQRPEIPMPGRLNYP